MATVMHAATVTPLFPVAPTGAPRPYLANSPTPLPAPPPPPRTPLRTPAPAAATPIEPPPRLDDIEVRVAPATTAQAAATVVPVSPAPPASPPTSPALKAAEARADAAAALLRVASDALADVQDDVLARARVELVELALHVARHVIGEHVAWGAFDLQPVIDNALAQLGEAIDVTIRIGENQHEAVARAMSEHPHVRIVVDPTFGDADVVVDSSNGSVDARLEHRLAAVTRAVRASVAP
jgi:hypothetical protein